MNHLVWARTPHARVFRYGTATAVAAPALSGRDRIAVAGAPEDALPLVRDVLAEVGPAYRPFGRSELIDELVRATPGLVPGGRRFLWMETARRPADPAPGVAWLDERGEAAAAALFTGHFPDSYAQPGRPGVRRWAGVHDDSGSLLAVAADAWSAAGCGFMAGVVTRPEARGRGLAAAVSRFVVDALVRDHGRAALMVDAGNPAAIAVYGRVGMRGYLFGAAAVG
ncbi:GNAT family N-acetyltransferase [Streptomyces sp. GbtcB6]|uniref:GNAT family N-acetyltransferase n=1 Tax=Streptomyces sp. GbtcB6 TaxID=2824751 RepID=UPI001C30B632|nr:GNAT family N-acetyltransferase [Streptomyces sp. GbtcB6]